MAKNYRVAIIGTGRMGGLIEDEIGPGNFSKPYSHFGAYAAIAETEVVAVANRGAERMQRFADRFGVTLDVTMQSAEVQFGLAHSHLQGGSRVSLPVTDRALYIPGG
jgi:predicted dehydrogenase